MGDRRLTRKLTAIFYSDVAGYSRLTGLDEEGTHRRLGAHLDQTSASIQQHGGRVLHYAGDAVLAEFASVLDAVSCAVAIQRARQRANSNVDDEYKLECRVGINLGDVIVDRDEVYGDGVNIAARLEALAEPGGICISRAVFEQVRGRLDLDCDHLGPRRVKNITEAVDVYRVLLDTPPRDSPPQPRGPRRGGRRGRTLGAGVALAGVLASVLVVWAYWPYAEPAPSASPQASIVVLPFSNLGDDPGQTYFSDGITQDITTDLSRFHELFVIASNTAFTFKGSAVNVQEVGRELGVRYALEGSVQRTNADVRINVQLIDATDGHQLWSERYERQMRDIFTLQDELVQSIVAKLAVRVGTAERERALRKATDNLQAYDHVLRGRERAARATREANIQAREMFRQAIELDSRYAAAYVALGWTFKDDVSYGWTAVPSKALQTVQTLAQAALAIEDSAEAHALLGALYRTWTEYDLALQELERAIELNPNYADSHADFGAALLYGGRTDDAIRSLETAFRLNPRMPPSHFIHLGLAYYLGGRYDDASRLMERAAGRYAQVPFLHAVMAATYARTGDPEAAARAAATVRRLHPFFDVEVFGSAFRDESDRTRISDGLRKAGL